MKAILGDYSDIPENLAEPTLSSTARDVTLWLDDLALRSTETLRACRSPRSRQKGRLRSAFVLVRIQHLHDGVRVLRLAWQLRAIDLSDRAWRAITGFCTVTRQFLLALLRALAEVRASIKLLTTAQNRLYGLFWRASASLAVIVNHTVMHRVFGAL
jgi:hypothetical protein